MQDVTTTRVEQIIELEAEVKPKLRCPFSFSLREHGSKCMYEQCVLWDDLGSTCLVRTALLDIIQSDNE